MSVRDGISSEYYLSPEELEAGLTTCALLRAARGFVELIVRRPAVEEREVVETAELDLEDGLFGDSWRTRGRSGRRPANEKAQITVMNVRSTGARRGDRSAGRSPATSSTSTST